MNTTVILGRLVRDPETKNVNGKSLVNFSVAVKDSKDKTFFFDCFAWDKTADLIGQYFKQGSKIAISGKLVQETWNTPDGKTASKVKILVEKFSFVESGKQDSSNQIDSKEMNPDDVF